jgi:hypothetical protein
MNKALNLVCLFTMAAAGLTIESPARADEKPKKFEYKPLAIDTCGRAAFFANMYEDVDIVMKVPLKPKPNPEGQPPKDGCTDENLVAPNACLQSGGRIAVRGRTNAMLCWREESAGSAVALDRSPASCLRDGQSLFARGDVLGCTATPAEVRRYIDGPPVRDWGPPVPVKKNLPAGAVPRN